MATRQQNRVTDVENKMMATKSGRGSGMNCKTGIDAP